MSLLKNHGVTENTEKITVGFSGKLWYSVSSVSPW